MNVKSYVVEAYEADWAAHSLEFASSPSGESLTRQEQAEEADINTIVKRFGITGMLPQNVRLPSYEDYDDIFDFQSAQNVFIEAEKSFMTLTAEVRAKFGNSPQEFLEFCSDEANRPEMVRLGLMKQPEAVVVAPLSDVKT